MKTGHKLSLYKIAPKDTAEYLAATYEKQ